MKILIHYYHEYITIENNKLSIQKYEVENTFYENLNQLKFKDIIKDSIKINLRSDVNLGLMMSSGLDSSIMQKK